jgi:N-acetylglucosaminyl-diphospho-decaprenol L-rhamnosyltransferase
MDLAIVIVSYNTRDLLADCLRSVLTGLKRSGLAGHVWVVDNASSDGSAGMVRQEYPDVRLVALQENLGFAAGNNAALGEMEAARGQTPRYFFFLNPDTLILNDALGALVRVLDSSPHIGAAGAMLVDRDGGFQHSAFQFPGLAQIFFDFFPVHARLLDSRLNGRYPRKLYEAGRPFLIDHPLGAALMVRSSLIREVGAFDERFFMYCEEVDLCRRIRAAGWEIACVPQARVVHLGGQSTQQFRDRMFVALWHSRFLMYDKHESRCFGLAARGLVRLGLRAEERRARAELGRGLIDSAMLAKRLSAYREVASL